MSPVGYVKGEHHFEKDPDRRVQEAIDLVFRKLLELGSVRQTLLWFDEHGLTLPVINGRKQVRWRRPSYGMVYSMLTNPTYGGAYAYGKTEQITSYAAGGPRLTIRRKPREDWLAFIPNAHDGYVSWEQFERVQAAIAQNTLGRGHVGAAQRGAALLAGLLHCRRCGHKLSVSYTGNGHDVLRYHCRRGWLDNGEPRCISFAGLAIDHAVSKEILRVVQPAAIEAARLADTEQSRQLDDVVAALQRDLQAAQYTAQRAQKQFDQVDPDNRLVAEELERRWNQALSRVRDVEAQIERHDSRHDRATAPSAQDFHDLAEDLEAVWSDPETDARLKKRILRTLIRDVIVDIDDQAAEEEVVIHWKAASIPNCACHDGAAGRTLRTRRGKPSMRCGCSRGCAPIGPSPAFSTATHAHGTRQPLDARAGDRLAQPPWHRPLRARATRRATVVKPDRGGARARSQRPHAAHRCRAWGDPRRASVARRTLGLHPRRVERSRRIDSLDTGGIAPGRHRGTVSRASRPRSLEPEKYDCLSQVVHAASLTSSRNVASAASRRSKARCPRVDPCA